LVLAKDIFFSYSVGVFRNGVGTLKIHPDLQREVVSVETHLMKARIHLRRLLELADASREYTAPAFDRISAEAEQIFAKLDQIHRAPEPYSTDCPALACLVDQIHVEDVRNEEWASMRRDEQTHEVKQ
jgi:hypothetical protein